MTIPFKTLVIIFFIYLGSPTVLTAKPKPMVEECVVWMMTETFGDEILGLEQEEKACDNYPAFFGCMIRAAGADKYDAAEDVRMQALVDKKLTISTALKPINCSVDVEQLYGSTRKGKKPEDEPVSAKGSANVEEMELFGGCVKKLYKDLRDAVTNTRECAEIKEFYLCAFYSFNTTIGDMTKEAKNKLQTRLDQHQSVFDCDEETDVDDLVYGQKYYVFEDNGAVLGKHSPVILVVGFLVTLLASCGNMI